MTYSQSQMHVSPSAASGRAATIPPLASRPTLKNRTGRPRGIPCSEERKRQTSIEAKARWADPVYRARMLKAIDGSIQKAHAAFMAMPRDAIYKQKMLAAAQRNSRTLPAMTHRQRLDYQKLRSHGIDRATALKEILG